jgi:hypothetical protein
VLRNAWQFGIGGQSRAIYYFHSGASRIYFLICYPTSRQKDLTEDEKAALKDITSQIKAHERARQP